jgi:ATP-dependent RNA helicase
MSKPQSKPRPSSSGPKGRQGPPGRQGPSFTETRGLPVASSFEEMNLKPDLLKGIYAYGFEKPSAIQQRAIIPIVQGRDTIAQSQSGTGKTAVFSISALQLLNSSQNETQVLVISPTRELAEQTNRVVGSIGDFLNVQAHACVGGKSVGEDMRKRE